jgi:hypothetical protein
MLCSVCKTTPLTVKNGHDYCPKCEIFIGEHDSNSTTSISDKSSDKEKKSEIIPPTTTVRPPGLIFIASFILLLLGISQVIASIVQIGILLFMGSSSTRETMLFYSVIGVPLILIFSTGSFLMIFLSFGLRRLRRWSFYLVLLMSALFVVPLAYLIYNGQWNLFLIGVNCIPILFGLYVISKSSLFISKEQAIQRGVAIDASYPKALKIIGIAIPAVIFLPMIIMPIVTIILNPAKNAEKIQYNYFLNRETNQLELESVVSDKKYTPKNFFDLRYSYSFKYPGNWTVEKMDHEMVVVKSNTNPTTYVRIAKYNNGNEKDIDIEKHAVADIDPNVTDIQKGQSKLSDLDAIDMTFKRKGTYEWKNYSIATIKKNYVYYLQLNSQEKDYGASFSEAKVIIDSFKIN